MDLTEDFESNYAGTPWPCAAGMLAGTLALMTRWAEPDPPTCPDPARLRPLMARKIVSNLSFLREHPQLPAGLRMVAAKLHAAWSEISAGAGARASVAALPAAEALH